MCRRTRHPAAGGLPGGRRCCRAAAQHARCRRRQASGLGHLCRALQSRSAACPAAGPPAGHTAGGREPITAPIWGGALAGGHDAAQCPAGAAPARWRGVHQQPSGSGRMRGSIRPAAQPVVSPLGAAAPAPADPGGSPRGLTGRTRSAAGTEAGAQPAGLRCGHHRTALGACVPGGLLHGRQSAAAASGSDGNQAHPAADPVASFSR